MAEPDTRLKSGTRVTVDLGDRAYDILIGRDLIKRVGKLIAERFTGARVAIVTDETVAHLHLKYLTAGMKAAGVDHHAIVVPAGEGSKSFAGLAEVVDGILAARLERGDLIVAFGGGVAGDLGGFAAAIVRRGMRVIQVPTTVLAQVDSSVGGKTGINTAHGKNLVGAFHQPRLVIADAGILDTLPPRIFNAGYAEVAKIGLINDVEFFGWLESNWRAVAAGWPEREHAITVACQAKADIVATDEHENGDRALLNLGHTFGHALETATGYSDRLLHGEGVAIGMVLALEFSAALNLCDKADALRAQKHLAEVGLPTHITDIPGDAIDKDTLMANIAQDKKVQGGSLNFILARGLGKAFIARDVPPDKVADFLDRKLNP